MNPKHHGKEMHGFLVQGLKKHGRGQGSEVYYGVLEQIQATANCRETAGPAVVLEPGGEPPMQGELMPLR